MLRCAVVLPSPSQFLDPKGLNGSRIAVYDELVYQPGADPKYTAVFEAVSAATEA